MYRRYALGEVHHPNQINVIVRAMLVRCTVGIELRDLLLALTQLLKRSFGPVLALLYSATTRHNQGHCVVQSVVETTLTWTAAQVRHAGCDSDGDHGGARALAATGGIARSAGCRACAWIGAGRRKMTRLRPWNGR